MQEARAISIHMILEERLGNGEEILASLQEQTWQDFQVVMLGQVDGGRERRADDGRTMWLRHYRHHGFARVHNQAIALALSRWNQQELRQRYIVLCHADIVWDPSALQQLWYAFQQDPTLMIAAPVMLRARRVPQDDEGGYEIERTEEVESRGRDFTRARRWMEHAVDAGVQQPYSVFGTTDACVMIRASALQDLQLSGEVFDPDLRSGQELTDLFWRAAWLDIPVQVVPSARVWHYAHRPEARRTIQQRLRDWYTGPARQERLSDRQRSLLELKNDDPLLRITHLPWIVWERLGYVLQCLLDPRLCLPTFDTERWLRVYKKRGELKKRRRVSRQHLRARFR